MTRRPTGGRPVYALAKALWVLVTRQRFPVPGEHRADVDAMAVASYTPHHLAGPLDELLQAATRLDPARRIDSQEMALTLEHLLAEPVAAVAAGAVDEKALRRLVERLRPGKDEGARREELYVRLREALRPAVQDELGPAFAGVQEVAPHSSQVGSHLHETTLLGWQTNSEEIPSEDVLGVMPVGFWVYTDDPNFEWSLSGGVALELLANGTLRLLGIVAVLRAGAAGYRKIHERREEVDALSPRAVDLCIEMASEVAGTVEAGLAAWSDRLEA